MPDGVSPEELTVGPGPLTGEIVGPSPFMVTEVGPAMAPPPAGELAGATTQERITAALGGEAALQVPQDWQTGPAPGEVAMPAAALRTATGGELQPSQLPRVAAAPGMQVSFPAQTFGAAPAGAPGPMAPAGPESALIARARAQGGDRAARIVQQLQAAGVSDDAIRARLGMAPAAGRGVGGGVMRPAQPELPEELQRPYETLFPPDYASRVAAAAVAGDISPEQAKKMMAGFEEWQKSPLGRGVAEAERQRGVAEQAGELEQQRLAAQQQAAQQRQALLEQQRAENEVMANEQRAQQEDYDRELADQTAKYEQAMGEAKRARIDPNRARIPIVDALAAAMGQFAAIMTGTPNAALQIINQRLDRDIAAQNREIETLEGAVAERRNRLGLLRQRFGDRQMARDAEKRLQLEQVASELNRIATTSEVEQNRVGAQKLALAVEDQIQGMKAQEQMGHAVAAEERKAIRAQQRLAGANALAMQRQRAQRQAEMQASGMGPWQTKGLEKMHKKFIPGLGFVASEKQAIDINTKLQRIDSAAGALRELVSLGKKGGASLDPKARARAQALATHAKMGMKDMYELGALSGPDMELMEQMVKDPAQITDMSAVTRLEQTGQILQSERGRALRGIQAIPGELTTIQDPDTGAPKAAYRLALPGRGATPAKPIAESPVAP